MLLQQFHDIMNNYSLPIPSTHNFFTALQPCSILPSLLAFFQKSPALFWLCELFRIPCVQNSQQQVPQWKNKTTPQNIIISKLVPAKQSYPQNCVYTYITLLRRCLWHQSAFIPYLEKKKQKCRQGRLLTQGHSGGGKKIYKF